MGCPWKIQPNSTDFFRSVHSTGSLHWLGFRPRNLDTISTWTHRTQFIFTSALVSYTKNQTAKLSSKKHQRVNMSTRDPQPRHNRRIDKSALFSLDPSVWFLQFIGWDSHHRYHSPWCSGTKRLKRLGVIGAKNIVNKNRVFLEKSNKGAKINKYGFPHSMFWKGQPSLWTSRKKCMFLSHDDIVSNVWMRQVKKSTFRVLCFVPLVLAAYATVAGTLRKTLLLSSHIKPVTNFG